MHGVNAASAPLPHTLQVAAFGVMTTLLATLLLSLAPATSHITLDEAYVVWVEHQCTETRIELFTTVQTNEGPQVRPYGWTTERTCHE